MLLVECNVLEKVKVINEGTSGNTRLRLQGKFQQCDEQNNNGRIYPKAILENQVKAIQEKICDRSLVGALDHPSNDAIHLSQASHLITKLWIEKDGSVMGECEILSTPNGKIVEALLDCGVKIGISSRGVGSVTEGIKGKIVNEDFKLITFDLVSDPSTRGAFPELTESIQENSQLAQQIVSKHKKDRVLLTVLENKINEAMKKSKKRKKKKKKSSFPDLTGDGKVTRADVLKGRGVIESEDTIYQESKRVRRRNVQRKIATLPKTIRGDSGRPNPRTPSNLQVLASRRQSTGDDAPERIKAAAQRDEYMRDAHRAGQGPKPVGLKAKKRGSENASTTIDRFADVIRERCWSGYKATPGVEPYAKGSCMPVGGKKKKKNIKK